VVTPFTSAWGWLSKKLNWDWTKGEFKAKFVAGSAAFVGTTSDREATENMQKWLGASVVGTAVGVALGGIVDKAKCDAWTAPVRKAVETKKLDLEGFISKPWYVQMQTEQGDQRKDELNCSMLQIYKKCGAVSEGQAPCKRFEWTMDVGFRGKRTPDKMNKKPTRDTKGKLCAKMNRGSEIELASCSMIHRMHGLPPLWVYDYDDKKGEAVLMRGAPDLPFVTGTCGYYDQLSRGIWVVTRDRRPSQGTITRILTKMNDDKIEIGRLQRVNQRDSCEDLDDDE